jgi:hypothetical protein
MSQAFPCSQMAIYPWPCPPPALGPAAAPPALPFPLLALLAAPPPAPLPALLPPPVLAPLGAPGPIPAASAIGGRATIESAKQIEATRSDVREYVVIMTGTPYYRNTTKNTSRANIFAREPPKCRAYRHHGLLIGMSGMPVNIFGCCSVEPTRSAPARPFQIARILSILQYRAGTRPAASSDMLRRSARCSACGARGATTMLPSWGGSHIGWRPFPSSDGLTSASDPP